jgi:hypothetical protein
MSTPPKHDYPALITEYEQRLAAGESKKAIEADFNSREIHPRTFQNNRTQWHKAHRSTPDEPTLRQAHPGIPEHLSTLKRTEIPLEEQHTPAHHGTLPDADSIEVHPGTLEGHQEVMEDIWLCRKFCSGGVEGTVAPVGGVIRRPRRRTVRPP